MIIVISTPLRIAASYAFAFALGAVVTCKWRFGRNLTRSNATGSTNAL